MRRLLIVIASLAMLLFAAGCGASSTHPTVAYPGTSQHVNPPKADDSVAVNNYNPCDLITADDLKAIYGNNDGTHMLTFDGVDPSSPPTNGIDAERTCGFAVMVGNGAEPDSSFTVMVTAYGEDSGGNVWNAMRQGQISIAGIGHDAFSDGTGLTAHKGKAIVKIWSVDDTSGQLDDKKQATLMGAALARVKS